MKNLILASTSTLHGGNYLEYLLPEITNLFRNCSSIVFIPFARPAGVSHDEYTQKVAIAFDKINIKVKGLHEFHDQKSAIQQAQGIFVGGGNTFLLVSQLYRFDIMQQIKASVNAGTPYLGCSAGSNIAGVSMQTTNDMPIVYPPSFETLNLLSFNLNPHYLDADNTSTHMGETRETRINEFHTINKTKVLGLREGSWLRVQHNQIELKGALSSRLFIQNKQPIEIQPNTVLDI